MATTVTAAITLLSALLGPAYSLRAVARGPATARTAALYTFARSLALVALAAGAFFAGSVGFLAAVTGAMLLVQAVDGCVGLWEKSLPRAAGPSLWPCSTGPACWPFCRCYNNCKRKSTFNLSHPGFPPAQGLDSGRVLWHNASWYVMK